MTRHALAVELGFWEGAPDKSRAIGHIIRRFPASMMHYDPPFAYRSSKAFLPDHATDADIISPCSLSNPNRIAVSEVSGGGSAVRIFKDIELYYNTRQLKS